MRRLSDITGAKVEAAIELLLLPDEYKGRFTWELTSAFIEGQGGQRFTYALTLCVPVPFASGDFEAPYKVLSDGNPDQEEVNEAVRELYAEASRRWAAMTDRAVAEERTAGGLIKGT